MPRYNFDEIVERRGTYCTQWDFVKDRFGQEDLLPFTVSDTDFAVPPEVTEALQKRMEHQVFGYTRWNHADFKNAVAGWFKRRFQSVVKEEWVLYSPSVIYSVAQLIELYSKEGEGVVIQTPGYDAFFKLIEAGKRKLVENPLRYEEGRYELDLEDLEKKLADPETTILLLCSPHNPSGRVWNREELEQIVFLCKQHNVFLISDEIHMDVLRPGIQHNPILEFQDQYQKMALCSSASKTFNTPGLGGSYLLLPDEKMREEFLTVLKNKHGLSSASILGITATMAAYKEGEAWLDSLNEYLTENLLFVKEYLYCEMPVFSFQVPESTYLAWIDTKNMPYTMEELQKALVSVGKVAIMNGAIYGGNGGQFLRLNVGCSREKLQDGLERWKQAWEYLQNQH